ncbi:hypothetical protein QFZ66_005915 [Streptomyces sp. B4I13]|uniref:hypothetical protein n=1 Tax=Streptomyces sp. B4I13 TaxID=3042271 RepID=UPI00278125B2|nr:hypothetical protein [Streptomyces sp. B4I13]MDQ0962037.1 hypothetical protein [Streptomyces sp. B4I13]
MSINLREFLVSWHGEPDMPPTPVSVEFDWLPVPLKEWHTLSSQWSKPLMRLNRMINPEHIEAVDGKAVFLLEGSGDWQSAFDTQSHEVVYESELSETWKKSPETLSEVIIHSALLEATTTGRVRKWSTQIEESLLSQILAPLEKVGLKGWNWYNNPNCQIFMNEKMVATVEPIIDTRHPEFNRPGYVDVQVATNNPEELSYLNTIPQINWREARS